MRKIFYGVATDPNSWQMVCHVNGRPIAEFLGFRNTESSDMSDLHELEQLVRKSVDDLSRYAQVHNKESASNAELVSAHLFPVTKFDEHYRIKGEEARYRERELSRKFMALVPHVVGMEDRMARLTMRLHDQSNGKIWPLVPALGKNSKTWRASQTKLELRKASTFDPCRLEAIADNRNSVVHERYYYSRLIEVEGDRDILFSPAMNVEETGVGGFIEYTLRKFCDDTVWFIDNYLVWWCNESVRQIQALP